MTTYEAGQSFSELPGDRHGVNASETKPAKLLAVFVVDTNETELRSHSGTEVIVIASAVRTADAIDLHYTMESV